MANPIATKYNVLYNGELAFERGMTENQKLYTENYFEILPVEPYYFDEQIKLRSEDETDFYIAEDKAIKAIQKYSIQQNGKQFNRKIDDAYMLLGKARYYNGRFIQALEAFNHLLLNYTDNQWFVLASVWREKTHIRLDRDLLAIENLQKLLAKQKLNPNQEALVKSVLAQAFINVKKYSEAVEMIIQSAEKQKDNSIKGRYFFIAGQLYERLGKRDLAQNYFQKVIDLNRKIHRKLWVEAQVGKIRNQSDTHENNQFAIELLKKLENKYEHHLYLDVLLYQRSRLTQNNKEAISLLISSLEANKGNKKLREIANSDMALLYFKEKDYLQSYIRYDSTLTHIPENTLEHLYVRRKRDNLQQVAENERIVREKDSVLNLLSMTDSQRKDFFEKIVFETQKNIDKKTSVKDKIAENQSDSRFYFYNPQAVSYGREQFFKRFGKIPLVDNWRWATPENKMQITENTIEESQPKEDLVQVFVSSLPNEKDIPQLEKDRNEALYQLGVIYFEKFSDNELAINRLERVLKLNPDAKTEQKTLYQLAKIYENFNSEKAISYKNHLQSAYPNSVYSQVLAGGVKVTENQLQQMLEDLNKSFDNQEFQKIFSAIETYENHFQTTTFAQDWELLKAKLEGRLKGLSAYKKYLQGVLKKYPDSQKIKSILDLLPSDEKSPDFQEDKNAISWKIIFEKTEENQLSFLQKWLNDCQKNHLTAFEDTYDAQTQWIVIQGFSSKEQALSVKEELFSEKNKNHWKYLGEISSKNYQIIQMYKNKSEYFKK